MQADYIRFLYISIYKFIDVIVISIRSSNFFLTIVITVDIRKNIYQQFYSSYILSTIFTILLLLL